MQHMRQRWQQSKQLRTLLLLLMVGMHLVGMAMVGSRLARKQQGQQKGQHKVVVIRRVQHAAAVRWCVVLVASSPMAFQLDTPTDAMAVRVCVTPAGCVLSGSHCCHMCAVPAAEVVRLRCLCAVTALVLSVQLVVWCCLQPPPVVRRAVGDDVAVSVHVSLLACVISRQTLSMALCACALTLIGTVCCGVVCLMLAGAVLLSSLGGCVWRCWLCRSVVWLCRLIRHTHADNLLLVVVTLASVL